MSRCTGHCCRSFVLSGDGGTTLHRSDVVAWLARAKRGKQELNDENKRVFRMVIPVEDKEDDGEVYTRFTCRNFDPESGNCMIYENRPLMCRDFPGNKVCMYKKCTRGC